MWKQWTSPALVGASAALVAAAVWALTPGSWIDFLVAAGLSLAVYRLAGWFDTLSGEGRKRGGVRALSASAHRDGWIRPKAFGTGIRRRLSLRTRGRYRPRLPVGRSWRSPGASAA